MKRKIAIILTLLCSLNIAAQINTDRVIIIGRNALYYEDYILAIQYFNQAINAKPYLPEPYYYRAIAKYYLDDLKGTEDDCTLALERNSFLTRVYQLRADARQGQGNYQGALEDYVVALDANPNDKFSLINSGIIHIQTKDYEDAEKSFDKLLQLYPKYAQGYLTRGAMYVESGDTIKAFEDYNQAISLDKYFSQAYSMRGLLNYYTQQYDSALVDLNEAINIDPLYVGNYINRGLIKYSNSDLRGAMADYDKVIDAEPNNTIARFNRGLLRAQVGDNNNAIEDFNNVLKFEPNNFMAIYNRALLRSYIADYNGAIADMDKILEKHPDYFNGYYARAEIKRKKNDLKGAEKDYNTARNMELLALKHKDDKGDKDKTREKSDEDLDKFNLLVVADKAEEEKSKYQNEKRGRVQNQSVNLEIEPRFVLSYYEKGSDVKQHIYFSPLIEDINNSGSMPKVIRLTNDEAPLNSLQIEEHFNSINDLSQKIARDTLNADLYFARAIDFMLVQDFQSSIEDFGKAIRLNPDFALAYFNQAVVYTKQLELKDYSAEYDINDSKTSLATTIADPVRTNNKAEGLRLEYDMILRNYNKVIGLDPEFAYAYYNRAALKYTQSDFRGAILDYNEAIRHNRNFYEAYFNRGLARFQVKDNERALEDMRKAGEGGIIAAYGIIKRMTEK